MVLMTTKIKKTFMRMSIIAVVFLLACCNGSHPPTLKIIQAEHTSTVTTSDTISESIETTVMKNKTVPESIENNNENDRPRNTKWADEDGNPKYGYFDVYGKQHTQHYEWMHVKPLYNGKDFMEEWEKYMTENNNFLKILEENNIQEARISISFEIIINTDGSIDAKLNDFSDMHQVLVDEYKRLLNAFHENGVVVPGKYDGMVMKARIAASSFGIRRTTGTKKTE